MVHSVFKVLLIAVMTFGAISCSEKKPDEEKNASPIKKIESTAQFEKVVNSSGSRLLVFDLYADWCAPCQILSPMLERLALEKRNKATVYKINVDQN
ncbi:MAG: hypothetical protein GF344_20465, partial [Chitinivibrionales bacterium]|nr:hypothetical protein [Chitinivibrionales bacterium]MBD3358976.1 hypothetical protein [Chitinivibrionales bacterium]